MLDNKTLALLKNVDSIKKELEHHIEEFDEKLGKFVLDIDSGLTACRCQYGEDVKDTMSLERLAEIREFYRTWNILSNALRGIL